MKTWTILLIAVAFAVVAAPTVAADGTDDGSSDAGPLCELMCLEGLPIGPPGEPNPCSPAC